MKICKLSNTEQTASGWMGFLMVSMLCLAFDGKVSAQSVSLAWTPPAGSAGNVVVYVAANAANGDGSTFGDHIYTNTYKVALRPRRPNLPFHGLKTPPVFRQRFGWIVARYQGKESGVDHGHVEQCNRQRQAADCAARDKDYSHR